MRLTHRLREDGDGERSIPTWINQPHAYVLKLYLFSKQRKYGLSRLIWNVISKAYVVMKLEKETPHIGT